MLSEAHVASYCWLAVVDRIPKSDHTTGNYMGQAFIDRSKCVSTPLARDDPRTVAGRGRERCERSLYTAHKWQNAVYSWPHWPCCFSMIRAARDGAMVARGQADI